MTSLTLFREEIDDFMQYDPHSPLEHGERDGFSGLNYYEENRAFVFEATVEHFPEDEPLVVMQTSTGDSREYRRWGRFSFEVEGQTVSLTIYSDAEGYDLFLPFKDKSNGEETYGAGRYMDNNRPGLRLPDENRVIVDFNFCYNPWCAYSEYYSCPLPPRENWLPVAIRAGEKNYSH
jgi:uncharacterized protein (DUF1684 family)